MSKEKDTLIEEVEQFLYFNFPQIQMHGGEAGVKHLDIEEGSVEVQLAGACSGCGISPMTIQAIKNRMPKEIQEIEQVEAETVNTLGDEGPAAPAPF